jgi:hypothetical protein
MPASLPMSMDSMAQFSAIVPPVRPAVTAKIALTILPQLELRVTPAPIEKMNLKRDQVNFFAHRYRCFFCRQRGAFLKFPNARAEKIFVIATVADSTAVANATGLEPPVADEEPVARGWKLEICYSRGPNSPALGLPEKPEFCDTIKSEKLRGRHKMTLTLGGRPQKPGKPRIFPPILAQRCM